MTLPTNAVPHYDTAGGSGGFDIVTKRLTIVKNETLDFTVEDLTIPANVARVVWTLSTHLRDDDSEAIAQIDDGSGLIRLNGEAAVTSSDGSLTVSQGAGSVRVVLTDDAISQMRSRTILHHGIKFIDGGGVSVGLVSGLAHVRWSTTKAV